MVKVFLNIFWHYFQPFSARKDWFYENLYPKDRDQDMLHVPVNENDMLSVERGTCIANAEHVGKHNERTKV